MALVNGCWFRATSGGTGDFAVASAITGYMTPAQAEAVDGASYSYRASSDDESQWEIGTGIYTASGETLSRSVKKSSNSNAAVTFSAAPKVALTALAEDFPYELLLEFDFSVTPTATFSIALDRSRFDGLIVCGNNIRIDTSTLDTGDYMYAFLVEADQAVPQGDEFNIPFLENGNNGGDIFEVVANNCRLEFLTTDHVWFMNSPLVVQTRYDNDVYSETSGPSSYSRYRDLPSQNSGDVVFNFATCHWDQSEGDYAVPPNATSGTLKIFGRK